jgi:hypothetical protein
VAELSLDGSRAMISALSHSHIAEQGRPLDDYKDSLCNGRSLENCRRTLDVQ